MKRFALPLVALAVLAGCGGTSEPSTQPSTQRATKSTSATAGPAPATASPRPTSAATGDSSAEPRVIGTVATGLDTPWGIGFLPDGSALVTERDSGRILHVVGRPGSYHLRSVGSISPTHTTGGESGLLGLAVSPTYGKDHRIFAYESTPSDNRVIRMTYADGRLSAPTPILTGIPTAHIHDGGRLAFGPDGYLYASTGETGNGPLAQDPDSLGGKILRITQDGKPAPGNPTAGSPVWTLGHRNVQGLAWDTAGRMWASEFGDHTWDELNLIQKGANYGWPEVEGRGDDPRFHNPQVVWHTDEASPSGLAFNDGYLWLGSLHGERLWRVRVDGSHAVEPTDFFVGKYGRLRTVVRAPDGDLWVTTSNRDDRGDPGPKDDQILIVRP